MTRTKMLDRSAVNHLLI